MASEVTIGLIGCGSWGKVILRELLFLGTEVCVADPENLARAEAIRLGAAEAAASLDDLPEVHGLVVATPASTHAQVIGRALARKIPVFTEKPFTTDVESARRLADEAGDRLFVMHLWRYHVGVRLLASLASEQKLGAVEWLRLTRTNWMGLSRDVDTIWNLLPHDLSIVLEILGYIPPAVSAAAELNRGAVTGLVTVLGDVPRVVIEISSRYSDNRSEVRLHCAEGVAVLPDTSSQYLEVTTDRDRSSAQSPDPERRDFSPSQPLVAQLRTFLNHVRDPASAPPRSSAAEGLKIVETIVKVRQLAGLRL